MLKSHKNQVELQHRASAFNYNLAAPRMGQNTSAIGTQVPFRQSQQKPQFPQQSKVVNRPSDVRMNIEANIASIQDNSIVGTSNKFMNIQTTHAAEFAPQKIDIQKANTFQKIQGREMMRYAIPMRAGAAPVMHLDSVDNVLKGLEVTDQAVNISGDTNPIKVMEDFQDDKFDAMKAMRSSSVPQNLFRTSNFVQRAPVSKIDMQQERPEKMAMWNEAQEKWEKIQQRKDYLDDPNKWHMLQPENQNLSDEQLANMEAWQRREYHEAQANSQYQSRSGNPQMSLASDEKVDDKADDLDTSGISRWERMEFNTLPNDQKEALKKFLNAKQKWNSINHINHTHGEGWQKMELNEANRNTIPF